MDRRFILQPIGEYSNLKFVSDFCSDNPFVNTYSHIAKSGGNLKEGAQRYTEFMSLSQTQPPKKIQPKKIWLKFFVLIFLEFVGFFEF
jgi:hypothetical protein